MKRVILIFAMLVLFQESFARDIAYNDGSGWTAWRESYFVVSLTSPSSFAIGEISADRDEKRIIEISIKGATKSFEKAAVRRWGTWLVYENCEIRYYAKDVLSLFFGTKRRQQSNPVVRRCTLKIQDGKDITDIYDKCFNVFVDTGDAFGLAAPDTDLVDFQSFQR